MRKIRIFEMRNSSILRLNSMRNIIQTDPEYQRLSDVWTLEKRQLLMDSIINDFDIPKIYFHEFPQFKTIAKDKKAKYAIIDGKQRLETIWRFINGDFPLSDDFVYFEDKKVKASGLTYADLAVKYPEIKGFIDSYTLPIILVITDDLDMIEEMFSRLNEAVPLNAAEKRNAFGGPMSKTIRKVSAHKFFRQNVAFSNKRYQHREVCCKFLWLAFNKRIIDTKKIYLDTFVKMFKQRKLVKESILIGDKVSNVLTEMTKIFIKKDPLLKTKSMPVIYYYCFRDAIENKWTKEITRGRLVKFNAERKKNRSVAEEDISKANYDLLEFDRMAQQGTNDSASISFRVRVLTDFVRKL